MSWNRRSAGSPPTLWWVLIFWAVFVSDVADSMTSGYSVPWVRKSIRPSLAGLLLEDPDELVADDLALLLGVLDPGQPIEEAAARLDHDQAHPEVALEGDSEQLRFLLAHQAMASTSWSSATRSSTSGRRSSPTGSASPRWPVRPPRDRLEDRHLPAARLAAPRPGRHRPRLEAHPRPGALLRRPRARPARPGRGAHRLHDPALSAQPLVEEVAQRPSRDPGHEQGLVTGAGRLPRPARDASLASPPGRARSRRRGAGRAG